MNVALDLAESGIEYALNNTASYAEARIISGQTTSFFIRNEALMSGSQIPWEGIGFRVLVNGGVGFCSVNQLTKNNVDSALKAAIKMARVSNPKHKIEFGEPVVNEAKWQIDFKENIVDVDNETILALITEMDSKAIEHSISARTYFFGKQRYNKSILTSEGTKIHADLSLLTMYINLSCKGKLDTEQRYLDYTCYTGWEGTKTWVDAFEEECRVLSKVAQYSDKRLKRGTVVDFLVSPEIAGIIAHENAGHPSEGDRIKGREGAQAGESFWRDLELGKSKVGSTHVTICDDPTIPKTGGYYEYDDEGVKSRKRVLVKEGIINEPLLNREFGVKFGLRSNGAARATSFDREPIIRMANTFFQEGDFTFDELVGDIKEGILMNSFTEWNIDDRRYQSKYVGQECYLIENGEITNQIIRRPAIETTTIGLLSSIDGISNKSILDFPATCGKSDPGQGIPVTAGGGHIRIRDIKLG